jgi:hypothetical protein
MPLTQKLIESKTLTSAAAVVTFSSIPSTYDHLMIRTSIRTSRFNDGYADVSIRANGDSTTSYTSLALSGHGGSTAGSTGIQLNNTAAGFFLMSSVPTAISNYQLYYANGYVFIPNYRTGNIKTGRFESFAPTWTTSGQGILRQGIFSYNNSNAITSITFTDENSAQMQAGSTLDLYGLVNS